MKQKDILLLSIPLFLMVLFGIGFNIYHNSVSSTIPANVNASLKPIQPTFDLKTIEDLKKRRKIQGVYDLSNPISSPSSQIPIPSITKEASKGGSINL